MGKERTVMRTIASPRLVTVALLAIAAGVIGAAAATASPLAPTTVANASSLYSFASIANPADPTFDQLLGIKNHGLIVGYYGSGADAKHPNTGFSLTAPGGTSTFSNENFPRATQTQVIAVTGRANTAGFWVDATGASHGFVDWNGVFTTVDDPLAAGKTETTQILGLNDKGVAVGFYNDAQGNAHAFKYNQATRTFTTLVPPGSDSATATGINASNEITGFLMRGKTTASFLVSRGRYVEFDVPGSTNTQALGLNNRDEVVGSYVDAAGMTHGFTATDPTTHATFSRIDDPLGIGNTIINGVNDRGQIVGFYTNAAKNTVGFVAAR
jgi:hypothetical protein